MTWRLANSWVWTPTPCNPLHPLPMATYDIVFGVTIAPKQGKYDYISL
jgi:hypothetical protein